MSALTRTDERRERARGLAKAWGAAAILHVGTAAAVVFLGLRTPTHGAGADYVPVTLVDAAPAEAQRPRRFAAAGAPSDTFRALEARLSGVTEIASHPSGRPPTDLGDLLGDDSGHMSAAEAADRPATSSGGGVLVDDPYSRASLGPAGPQPKAADPIRTKAQSCWLGGRAPAPIRVEFRLSPQGAVLGEPRVRRSPFAASTSAQAAAERRAVRALVDCAPYPVAPDVRVSVVYALDLG